MSKKSKKVLEYAEFVREKEPYFILSVGINNSHGKNVEVLKKAQSAGVPWEDGTFYSNKRIISVAKIDGKVVDVSMDSKAKKMLPNKEEKDKKICVFYDRYLSKRHSWGDVINNLWGVISRNGGRVLDSSIGNKSGDIKAIFKNGITEEAKKGIIEEAEDYGITASFHDNKKGYIVLKLKQTGIDKSSRPSENSILVDYKGNYWDKRLKPAKKDNK